jgi:predicted dehydrogenase
MNALPRAVEPKAAIVVMHRTPGRELMRQHPPRTTGAIEVQDAVDHLPHVDFAVTTARLGRRDQRFDDRPLSIGQVRWVRHPCHNKHIGSNTASHTLSRRFAEHYKAPAYDSLESLLKDPEVDLVLNLTNPTSHFEVSRACLEAGKHVYSEKPLALTTDDAHALVTLAAKKGLRLSGAPCSLLSETAQTIWKAVRENQVGPTRLVYAELDEGLLHRMPHQSWLSDSGTPWPAQDEFEVGNALEHAGYYLTWLTAMFGPVESVTAFGSVQVPDKLTDQPLVRESADLTVACLRFASG